METLKPASEPCAERGEQVQDIISKMPTNFAFWVTGVILLIVTLLFVFGWLIKYPDIATGEIVISSRYAPVKLVANSPGKISLLGFKSKDDVKERDYIAIIQNSSSTNDVIKLNGLLKSFDSNRTDLYKSFTSFPSKMSLGDINVKYYGFLNALQQLYTYHTKDLFKEQEDQINVTISKLKESLANDESLRNTKELDYKTSKKIFQRDSLLYSEKVIAEDDADHSRLTFLNSKESYQTVNNEINSAQQQIEDQESKLEQLITQKQVKEQQMNLDLLSADNDLKDNIKTWEEHYVFKAPFNGKVEFLKFLNDGEFVAADEEIFSIVPKQNKIIGHVQLPAHGAGKVKVGQKVIIKLDNYPYEEYGYVNGKVSSISLITNLTKVNQNNLDTYLVDIELPENLETNYGSKLEFKYGIKGTAEIVTNDRRLIQRFFDNLKYSVNK
ncbi:HlyD family efflux transporter periplasmic adaptor subunit [Mucilaginibacter sp. L196]|uniref:HlyD family efflux transporter periplasmic adaptor subunit n=1 Tax=Mucilaginibacter sp. L196 TaxID=1641870 RepID=UPI00131B22B9|nr:HlyD family efflux transporter periplasmic adaptor subunit [Mucilaginibacter sp. L196]